jgi:plastocyanin domain-containing protein
MRHVALAWKAKSCEVPEDQMKSVTINLQGGVSPAAIIVNESDSIAG